MSLYHCISTAAQLAYDEDREQIVGRIQGEWAFADTGDAGRLATMDPRTTFTVSSDGADRDQFLGCMERLDIEGAPGRKPGTTRFDIDDDESALVDATGVDVRPRRRLDLIHPVTGGWVTRDISELTEHELDAYARLMETELREVLHSEGYASPPEFLYASPPEFLAAWARRVGPEAAGLVILGS